MHVLLNRSPVILRPRRRYTLTMSTTIDATVESRLVAYPCPTAVMPVVVITLPGETSGRDILTDDDGSLVRIDITPPSRGPGTATWSLADGERVLLAVSIVDPTSYLFDVVAA